MSAAKESCPLCGALPCDWVDDPHQTRDSVFMALADLRIKAEMGERPMLTEVPGLIAKRLHKAKTILAAMNYLADESDGRQFSGRDMHEWSHQARLWLLNED